MLGQHITNEHPHQNGLDPKLDFLAKHVSGRLRPALIVFACSVGVVMLIVCANLSNLLLARTATRQKEMAIRTALGAGTKAPYPSIADRKCCADILRRLAGIDFDTCSNAGHGPLDRVQHPAAQQRRVDTTALGFTLLVAASPALSWESRPRCTPPWSRSTHPWAARFERKPIAYVDSWRPGRVGIRICMCTSGRRRIAYA